ncbi:MAG: S8 family serine peptidase [Candidatus Binatia bacterium]
MSQHDLDDSVKTSVRVAIIDSGINPRHPHVSAVTGGIAFSLTDEGEVQQSDDYIDRRGHGTALAGIIRAKAPQVELYAVKIFRDPRTPNDPLTTSIAVLEAGFRWAIEQVMHVINFSLGTTNPAHRDRLDALVTHAHNTGSIVVASAPPGDTTTLPAALSGVIGVAGDDACAWNEYRYIRNDPVPFRAHPRPRPIPGISQERNFHGHSCASAHVTALLALLLQQKADLTAREANTLLQQVIHLNSTR